VSNILHSVPLIPLFDLLADCIPSLLGMHGRGVHLPLYIEADNRQAEGNVESLRTSTLDDCPENPNEFGSLVVRLFRLRTYLYTLITFHLYHFISWGALIPITASSVLVVDLYAISRNNDLLAFTPFNNNGYTRYVLVI